MNFSTKLIFSAIFSSFVLCAGATDSTYIDVTVKGIPAGTVKLVGVYGDQNYLADSTLADAHGHFVLRRKHPLPAGFYTFLLPGTKNFSLLLDEDQHFTLTVDINDVVGTMQVEGSECVQIFYYNAKFQAGQETELKQIAERLKSLAENSAEYQQLKIRQDVILNERKKHLDEIFNQYPHSFFTKFKMAGQNPDLTFPKKANGDLDTLRQLLNYRAAFWNGVDFNDTRLLYTPVIANKLRRYIKEITPQHRDSIWAVAEPLIRRVIPYKQYFKFFANWIALQYENTKTSVMDGEAVYVKVIKYFFTPELAFWSSKDDLDKLQKHAWEMEASLIGKPGPDVQARDINGQLRSIYEIKSHLVVVFMFAPDCEHCQKEAPEVERLYKKWKPRGVEFFGIALDTDAEKATWKNFVRKYGFSFPVVNDPTNRAIYAKYFVDITPEIYVLDKNRTIIYKNLKSSQLDEVFERELKKIN